MNAIVPVFLLLLAFVLFVRVGVVIWDAVATLQEHAWHPAKLGAIGTTIALGIFFMILLAYLMGQLYHFITIL